MFASPNCCLIGDSPRRLGSILIVSLPFAAITVTITDVVTVTTTTTSNLVLSKLLYLDKVTYISDILVRMTIPHMKPAIYTEDAVACSHLWSQTMSHCRNNDRKQWQFNLCQLWRYSALLFTVQLKVTKLHLLRQ